MGADKENLLGNLEFLLLVIIPFILLTLMTDSEVNCWEILDTSYF